MATSDAERLRPALRTFFDRLKRERKTSRSRLCQMAKVSESTVRAFLAGQTKTMQHDTLEKLARAAGVTVEQMLGNSAKGAVAVTSSIDHDRMHALLVGIGTLLERERIKLAPRDFADLVMAIYGVAGHGEDRQFKMSKEVERLVLLYAKRG